MRRRKMWDDMTPQEKLQEWELTMIEMEGIIERRKKSQEDWDRKEKEKKEGKPTGS